MRGECLGRILMDNQQNSGEALVPLDCMVGAKALAQQFHETYERLAPQFGYETKEETRQFQEDTPNGLLMIAVCQEILRTNDTDETRSKTKGEL